MNRLAISLYQEACAYAYELCRVQFNSSGGAGDPFWSAVVTAKFAELIVQECAEIAQREDHDPAGKILAEFDVTARHLHSSDLES
jgi:hypothetical protein